MEKLLEIDHFIAGDIAHTPLFDVRSPCEFALGHIPGSISLPLFSDEERKEVGTIYKHVDKASALIRGLEFVGPKMAEFSRKMLLVASSHNTSALRILCWRGGMRSESMAWLATKLQLEPIRLKGGYKAYRNFAGHLLQVKKPAYVIGGYTGSGKSEILQKLQKKNFPTLDLEEFAEHRGSVFGNVVQETAFFSSSISQEQFENRLAFRLHTIRSSPYCIIEDESRLIGPMVIPSGVWSSLQNPIKRYMLCIRKEERIQRIMKDYGKMPVSWLIQCVAKLEKKLGLQKVRCVIQLISTKKLEDAIEILLGYYDTAYQKTIDRLWQGHYEKVFSHEELLEKLDQDGVMPFERKGLE